MNWGNKLLGVFILFAAMISYLVYRCVQIPVDLVEKDYYQTELAYQEKIDGAAHAYQLSSQVQLKEDSGRITVHFPDEMKSTAVQGTMLFYCAADQHKDRKITLRLSDNAEQQITSQQLAQGNYTVKIDWVCKSVRYYAELPFTNF
jgi:hypothetical protein